MKRYVKAMRLLSEENLSSSNEFPSEEHANKLIAKTLQLIINLEKF